MLPLQCVYIVISTDIQKLLFSSAHSHVLFLQILDLLLQLKVLHCAHLNSLLQAIYILLLLLPTFLRRNLDHDAKSQIHNNVVPSTGLPKYCFRKTKRDLDSYRFRTMYFMMEDHMARNLYRSSKALNRSRAQL